ncbi:YiiD C-terminal domain-containing protein [Sphingomonas sp. BK235]|uniref:YiiD C-terminal domain-containing protein n=1 Tax=Sphingomonas sp. BK235 TaxID=2512131 RepID=UPI0010539FE5|nr:YiiD C-terminal domain-containing protein [Sphingomonas sp. BK235]TCP37035.1 thioesterase domain-containing protein [Sphingomonas sp. BK235]
MEREQLERYLHRQIPLSAAMGVTVVGASPDAVELSAPLAPNVNHKRTAFGGSLSTLGILAAWSLVHLRLVREEVDSEVVIQSNHMHYDAPVTGAFTARAALTAPADWPLFVRTLRRRGRARVTVHAALVTDDGVAAGRLDGRFVALLRAH